MASVTLLLHALERVGAPFQNLHLQAIIPSRFMKPCVESHQDVWCVPEFREAEEIKAWVLARAQRTPCVSRNPSSRRDDLFVTLKLGPPGSQEYSRCFVFHCPSDIVPTLAPGI